MKFVDLAELRAEPPGIANLPSIFQISSYIGNCFSAANEAYPAWSSYFSIRVLSVASIEMSKSGFSIKKIWSLCAM
jgi:hypothetical protein